MIAHLVIFKHHRAARATGLIFAASGLLLGSWAALIPFVKTKFDLDEAQLGLLLLALPMGVMVTNPLSVPLLNRLGAVRLTLSGLVMTGLLFILPFALPSVWLVAAALFLAGAGYACTNVAMNTCASLLEQQPNLRIMSSCHGFWSVGAMSGSAMGGMVTGWGFAPVLYLGLLAFFEIIIAWQLRPLLAEVPGDLPASSAVRKSSGFILPNKALWVLIIISLCVNLTEGTMTDWSAVYMQEVVQAPATMAGWGFAVYAFFMAGGRLLGDELMARFGSKMVLRAGGVIAALGLFVVVFVPGTVAALAGFALTGAGVSVGSPILYGAAAKVPGMAKGAGLATMNSFAIAGYLGGPAFIGFLAKAFSLQAAFALVAVFAAFWAWRAGRMK